jgi:NAD(P)-dependent dehydrogenase (short-subunit alcohol dehydrogenase family)
MNQAQRIALVTGGSRGLGRDMALSIAEKGMDVLLTYHSQQDAASTLVKEIEKRGRKASALQLDVGDTTSFGRFGSDVRDALKHRWSREQFDCLVNNAGVGVYVPFEQTTEEQFDSMMRVHLKGVFFLTQKLLPLLADGGRIINISSGLTRFTFPGYSAYAVMKGAIEVFTHYLAKELGGRGIAVNTVAPGAIETDFGGGAVRDNAELNRQIASMTALGRVGVPEDIGGVVAALLAPEGRWVNAQRIEVSGGMSL